MAAGSRATSAVWPGFLDEAPATRPALPTTPRFGGRLLAGLGQGVKGVEGGGVDHLPRPTGPADLRPVHLRPTPQAEVQRLRRLRQVAPRRVDLTHQHLL